MTIILTFALQPTASYPCFLTINVPANDSQGVRSPSVPNPHNPIFDYYAEFELYSLQSDLTVYLYVLSRADVARMRHNRYLGGRYVFFVK